MSVYKKVVDQNIILRKTIQEQQQAIDLLVECVEFYSGSNYGEGYYDKNGAWRPNPNYAANLCLNDPIVKKHIKDKQ